MLKLRLVLDGSITSVNKTYMRSSSGGVFLAPEVKAYRAKVFPKIVDAYKKSKDKFEGGLIVMKVEVHTHFFTKGNDVRKVDIDNFAKNIIDAVFPALGIDDKMIFDLRLQKKNHTGEPKCVIHLKEIPRYAK